MARWQGLWDASPKGRWTHQCIPDIRRWHDREFGELTYYTAQMLTGHGDFQTFLHRIGKSPSDTCLHCEEHPEDTVTHTILECRALEEQRRGLRFGTVPRLVEAMLESCENWKSITLKVDSIMSRKRELGAERARRLLSTT